MSDIDAVAVDSLKALDPEWPIREADIRRAPTGLVLEIEIDERLVGGIADDEALHVLLNVQRAARIGRCGHSGPQPSSRMWTLRKPTRLQFADLERRAAGRFENERVVGRIAC